MTPFKLNSLPKFLILGSLLFLSTAYAGTGNKRTPDEVLLVVNARSSVSRAIADDYAVKRHIVSILSVQCEDSAFERAQ